MKAISIDGAVINNRVQAHEALRQAFDFSADYGGTLDSLWDMLSDYPDVVIRVDNCHQLYVNLGGYGNTLLDLLGEASAENERIRLVLCD